MSFWDKQTYDHNIEIIYVFVIYKFWIKFIMIIFSKLVRK